MSKNTTLLKRSIIALAVIAFLAWMILPALKPVRESSNDHWRHGGPKDSELNEIRNVLELNESKWEKLREMAPATSWSFF